MVKPKMFKYYYIFGTVFTYVDQLTIAEYNFSLNVQLWIETEVHTFFVDMSVNKIRSLEIWNGFEQGLDVLKWFISCGTK